MTPTTGKSAEARIDPGASEYYINRELSWLEFNQRVLEESVDSGNPLLERFRFASIASSNLDEFIMVRVAALKNAETEKSDPAGYTPSAALVAISQRAHAMVDRLYEIVLKELLPQAAGIGIEVHSISSLTPEQKSALSERFEHEIFPVLTPMAIDPSHPFPILLNLTLNIGISLAPGKDDEKSRLALVPIPPRLPRLWRVSGEGHHYVLLEEVVRSFLSRLFAGQEILEHVIFRITRDAELEFDDEGSPNLMKTIEIELRKRRTSPVVRLEVEQAISKPFLKTFTDILAIQEQDLYLSPAFLDPRFLSAIADLPGFDAHRYVMLPPQVPPEFQGVEKIWPVLREKEVLLHHPYESFEPVVQLISQAADDPEVLAIKQTLYRTSGDSPVVRALERAALNGKQVTVLVELTARFDEERNIEWAKRLEQAGAHVIYGLVDYKTHAKILLIVRREPQGLRRYVHLSTGNYNDRTARLYTDVGMLTSDEEIGTDASGFFNTITGYSDPPVFKKLVMAPVSLRERILHLIRREAERAKSGQDAMILAKMNSLVDTPIIRALYEASQAGVLIKLAVRGICCLRPGIKGISDRITVVSVVDRFLEHSRILYVSNGGDEEYYCTSADWMPRNLDRRVELLFPVQAAEGRKKLREILDLILDDNVKARLLQSDGAYMPKKRKKGDDAIRSQDLLYSRTVEQKELSQSQVFKPLTTPK
jgi:polyphosphate kinase